MTQKEIVVVMSAQSNYEKEALTTAAQPKTDWLRCIKRFALG
jgi:hypothetical protein